MTRFAFTSHALQRLAERAVPGLVGAVAEAAIEETCARDAVLLRARTDAGDAIWEVESLNARLVTRQRTEGGAFPVVTVLDAGMLTRTERNDRPPEFSEAEREHLERYAARTNITTHVPAIRDLAGAPKSGNTITPAQIEERARAADVKRAAGALKHANMVAAQQAAKQRREAEEKRHRAVADAAHRLRQILRLPAIEGEALDAWTVEYLVGVTARIRVAEGPLRQANRAARRAGRLGSP